MSFPYQTTVKTIQGEDSTLEEYRGKVLLIVNVASKCGFTAQYQGLEEIYKHFHEQGLVVLGFPCNQFGSQEPGTEQEIAQFCSLTFGVTFPLFAKVSVQGADTHPLFDYLKKTAPGLLGSEAIKWNFTKFLVSRDGKVVTRYAPSTAPTALVEDIERALTAS
jgi:glutathione peroxidase